MNGTRWAMRPAIKATSRELGGVLPVYKKEAPALGEADTPIDEVLDVRHMPSRAAGGANAARIKGGGDAAQICYSSLADCFDDWQRIRSEQRGILGLGFPPKCSGIWALRRLPSFAP
jgi:hypothetical protein